MLSPGSREGKYKTSPAESKPDFPSVSSESDAKEDVEWRVEYDSDDDCKGRASRGSGESLRGSVSFAHDDKTAWVQNDAKDLPLRDSRDSIHDSKRGAFSDREDREDALGTLASRLASDLPMPPSHPVYIASSSSSRRSSSSSKRSSATRRSYEPVAVSVSVQPEAYEYETMPAHQLKPAVRGVEPPEAMYAAQASSSLAASPSHISPSMYASSGPSPSSSSSSSAARTTRAGEETLYSIAPLPVVATLVDVNPGALAAVRFLRMVIVGADALSPGIAATLRSAEPTIARWSSAVHFVLLTFYVVMEVAVELGLELYSMLRPFSPDLLLPCFLGLVMCFFGGSFVTSIAAFEAYRLVGFESTWACVRGLAEDFNSVLQAAERDAAAGMDDPEPQCLSDTNYAAGLVSALADTNDFAFATSIAHATVAESGALDAPAFATDDNAYSPIHATRSRGAPRRRALYTYDSSLDVFRATVRQQQRAEQKLADEEEEEEERQRLQRYQQEEHTETQQRDVRTPKRPPRRSIFRTPQKSTSPLSSPSTSAAFGTPKTYQQSPSSDRKGGDISSWQASSPAVQRVRGEAEVASAQRFPKRPSTQASPSTLAEYQREVELQATDTTTSKALFFLQNVDPCRFNAAIVGLNAGLVAVVATLKTQFAKTITLGTALGRAVEGPAKELLTPLVSALLPPQYTKWSELLLSYAIKSAAISVAWMLRRVVSSYHSAIRGGLMFAKNLSSYLQHMDWVPVKDLSGEQRAFWEHALGYAVAGLGLYFQLSYGFSLPFPLNVLLFPFTLLEYLLLAMISK